MNTQKRYAEELLLMGGCPTCGADVNREFVEDTIDRIVARAKKEAFEEGRDIGMKADEELREEGRKEERERIKGLFPKLNPNSDSWGTTEMERILKQIDQITNHHAL